MPQTDDLLAAAYDAGMIKVAVENPFELSSGIQSPLYINANPWTQYADVQQYLRSGTDDLLQDVEPDYLAGMATGGLTYGLLAQQAASTSDAFTPYVGIRKSSEDHRYVSSEERVVGEATDLDGQEITVCDDVGTTGGSLADATTVLESVGAEVSDWVVPWLREEGGIQDTADDHGVDLHYLTTTHDVLQYGIEHDYVDEEAVPAIEAFLDDPQVWNNR